MFGVYGFAYAHEQVYSPLVHLIWKDLYAYVIPIMRGFHQLKIIQKILYKRHQCMGYKDWFVYSEITVPESAEQGFEGRHYFRSMRLHKEVFVAIVRTKVESHTKNIESLLLSRLKELRKSSSPALVEEIMKLDAFKEIKNTLYQLRVLNLK